MTPSTNPARDEAVSLLPCPFCGGPAKMISCMAMWESGGYPPDGRRITCEAMDCYGVGKPFYGQGMEAKAIAWWNHRPAAPAPASGVDAVARIIAKWVDEERHANAPAFRMAAREVIASLSPAATSGSEAGDLTGHEAVARYGERGKHRHANLLADFDQSKRMLLACIEDRETRENVAELLMLAEQRALAKPSSPAGGDVREALDWTGRQIRAAKQAMKESAALGNGYANFAAHDAHKHLMTIRAALSPSISAAEPVAWHDLHNYPPKEHPAPAAVESAQGVKEAVDAEREACARVVDAEADITRLSRPGRSVSFDRVAAAIRARASLATEKEG